jgi:hypothetical protein
MNCLNNLIARPKWNLLNDKSITQSDIISYCNAVGTIFLETSASLG